MAALVIFKKYGDITTIHFLQLLDTIRYVKIWVNIEYMI